MRQKNKMPVLSINAHSAIKFIIIEELFTLTLEQVDCYVRKFTYMYLPVTPMHKHQRNILRFHHSKEMIVTIIARLGIEILSVTHLISDVYILKKQ